MLRTVKVWRFIGVALLIGAIFAFDYYADLPSWVFVPELFECVTAEEAATGVQDHGFQFCP
jgi:hypothetical protein